MESIKCPQAQAHPHIHISKAWGPYGIYLETRNCNACLLCAFRRCAGHRSNKLAFIRLFVDHDSVIRAELIDNADIFIVQFRTLILNDIELSNWNIGGVRC